MTNQTYLTIIVAVIGIFIAWQQSRVARTKLRFDLYDERYAAFEAIKSVVWTAGIKQYPDKKSRMNDLSVALNTALYKQDDIKYLSMINLILKLNR